jgi:hypothetical protein
MIKHLTSIAIAAPRINQEPGSNPGEGLTAIQTFTYFVAAPVALFLVISVLVWAGTSTKKARSKTSSVITSIE